MSVKIPTDHPDITITVDGQLSTIVNMLSSYLMDSVNIYLYSGISTRNTPTYTLITNVPCRFEETNEMVSNNMGEEVVSKGKFYIGLENTLDSENDYLVYNDIKYSIIKVETKKSFTNSHYIVWVR